MLSIGRMAAGESGAFAGAKRLRSNRDIVRQRIGDHRLLFRLHPQTIELLALIPRRDLERRIKSLTAG
jgi:mRNA-degrading endonuclease RelE of RelBE toxin-antitoxin system